MSDDLVPPEDLENAQQIAADLVNMVDGLVESGYSSSVIGAGIALGLLKMAESHDDGRVIGIIVASAHNGLKGDRH